MGEGEGILLVDLEIAEVVVPDAIGGVAFGEEDEVSFHTCSSAGEDSTREAEDTPDIGIIEELSFGLDEGGFGGAEEDALI